MQFVREAEIKEVHNLKKGGEGVYTTEPANAANQGSSLHPRWLTVTSTLLVISIGLLL